MEMEKYDYLVPNVFLFFDRKCSPDWVIEKRQNFFHDLTFVMGGKANYFVNGQKYTVETGDLIYIPPGSVREAHTFRECPMHAYPFNFHWLEPNNVQPLPFGIVTKNMITKEILDLIREFKQVWMSKQPFYVIQARAIFQLILHRLLSNYFRQSTTQTDPRIKKITAYISEHYAEDIKIGDLARLFNLHPVYLGKLFKQNTGLTYKEYIHRIRINNAEMMLSSGDFTVTETAERCGFRDVAYFSKMFKTMKGYPPSAAKKCW
jgi:AraC-like DNA-binding protein